MKKNNNCHVKSASAQSPFCFGGIVSMFWSAGLAATPLGIKKCLLLKS